jgi:hypothetical protein
MEPRGELVRNHIPREARNKIQRRPFRAKKGEKHNSNVDFRRTSVQKYELRAVSEKEAILRAGVPEMARRSWLRKSFNENAPGDGRGFLAQ